MKKLFLVLVGFSVLGCGEQSKEEKTSEVKQPFSLSDEVQTGEKKSEVKQPFSLSDEVQTKSK